MTTGPERIRRAIDAAHQQGRAALLVNLPGLERDPQWTADAAQAAVAAGADMLEIQEVHSPGHRLVIERLRAMTSRVDVPCLLWVDRPYLHRFVIDQRAEYRLVPECIAAGAAGMVAPVPTAHIETFALACGDDLAPIAFVSPQAGPAHLEQASRHNRGFLYAIGLKTSPPADPQVARRLAAFARVARERSGLPVITGAGVATPEQAALAASVMDGVAVAGAVERLMREARSRREDDIAALASFVRMLRAAIGRSQGD
jgi:tryptophan synthase alpha chain